MVIRPNTDPVEISSHNGENDDVESTSVLIVRTGAEDGLSSPITFDSIAEEQRTSVVFDEEGRLSAVETTLETAVRFLMELEQREIAAFGPRPDPVESARNMEVGFCEAWDELFERAVKLGWDEDMQRCQLDTILVTDLAVVHSRCAMQMVEWTIAMMAE